VASFLNGSLTCDSGGAPIAKRMNRPAKQPANISRGWLGAALLALSALLAHGLTL